MNKKIGRNDPCPCGSGKKYKKCCIDKDLDTDLESLYLKQLEYTKKLNCIERCNKIIEIGKNILEHGKKEIFITGTHTNISLAYRVRYYLTNDIAELNQAKYYCEKALELKPTNQSALKIMYGIALNLKEYDEAAKALEKFSVTDISNPLCVQIVEEYQTAIQIANAGKHTDNIRDGLGRITDILLNKFDKNPGICAVVMMYYMGIGNDMLRAYELGKRSVEAYPDATTYNNLGWICINPDFNRYDEAIGFYRTALELSNDNKLTINIKGNYFIALLSNGQLDEAEVLMKDLIKENPCNQNFSNYAELLKRKGDYEEALNWARKALFLVEDDSTLLVIADIYKRIKDYTSAIEMYKKCLDNVELNGNAYIFKDANGIMMSSFAANNEMNWILYEAFKGIISAYNSLKEYNFAKIYLEIAKEKLPQKSDWSIWEETLADIELNNQLYIETKMKLDDCLENDKSRKTYIRQWALKLIQLQDETATLDLDTGDEWAVYEQKMNDIILEMSNIINREGILYQQKQHFINNSYPQLSTEAKEFLITAEVLYEMHSSDIIDFAPIVVEYSKVVETQLRMLLYNQLPADTHMLGEIIGFIRGNTITPYYNYLTDLSKINRKRRKSAHTGALSKTDADYVKNILYENDLLNKLV